MNFIISFFRTIFSIYWLILIIINTISWCFLISTTAILPKSWRTPIVANIIRYWGKVCVWIGFCRIKIIDENKDNKLKPGKGLFMVNHLASADIIFSVGFAPLKFLFFSTAGVFKIPFVGYAMRAANFIPVDRSSPRKAGQSLLTTIKRVEEGNVVLIYPEGTRNIEAKDILPFKLGATVIAERTKCPMYPMVLVGTDKIFTGKSLLNAFPGKVILHILKPITIEDELHPANTSSSLTPEEKLEAVRKMMSDLYLKYKK